MLFRSVYATLERLADKGLLASLEEAPAAGGGGRIKRIYRVTAAGKRAVEQTQEVLARMMEGLRSGMKGSRA